MQQGREEGEGFTDGSNIISKGRTRRMRSLCPGGYWPAWGWESCEVQGQGEDHRVAPSLVLHSPIPAAMTNLTTPMALSGYQAPSFSLCIHVFTPPREVDPTERQQPMATQLSWQGNPTSNPPAPARMPALPGSQVQRAPPWARAGLCSCRAPCWPSLILREPTLPSLGVSSLGKVSPTLVLRVHLHFPLL